MEKQTDSNPFTLSSSMAFRLLFLSFWTRYTVIGYFLAIIRKIPFLSVIEPLIFPVWVISLLVLMGKDLRRIRISDFCFMAFCCIMLFASLIIFPENSSILFDELWRIIGLTIPLYFMGIYFEYESIEPDLQICSIIGVFIALFYQLYCIKSGKTTGAYNMDAAYKVLPSVIVVIASTFNQTRGRNIFCTILGVGLILTYGTRGPIVAVLAVIVVLVFSRIISKKNFLGKSLYIIVSAILGYILCSTDVLFGFMKTLAKQFSVIGFSTRIFDSFFSGEFSVSVGRDNIRSVIIESIKKHPLLGNGIMSDRIISGGDYSHNIILEILCSFGVVLGTIIIIAIAVVFVRGIRSSKNYIEHSFVIGICLMIVIKLMLSGSFIIEQYFFFCIGLCVHECRKINDEWRTEYEDSTD